MEDVTSPVAYLASSEAAIMTGRTSPSMADSACVRRFDDRDVMRVAVYSVSLVMRMSNDEFAITGLFASI